MTPDERQALEHKIAELTRECDLFHKQALAWNAEADRYLAQRDELTVRLAVERQALEALKQASKRAFVVLEGLRLAVEWELAPPINKGELYT